MDKAKQDFDEKLRDSDFKLAALQQKVMLRETASRNEKVKLTKEIIEDLKKND